MNISHPHPYGSERTVRAEDPGLLLGPHTRAISASDMAGIPASLGLQDSATLTRGLQTYHHSRHGHKL